MGVKIMLNNQARKAAKCIYGEGFDCWGSAQKLDPGENTNAWR